MKISASYYSEVGGRDKNEDSVAILESGDAVLGIVADGLGGHSDGEIASKMAVRAVNSGLVGNPVGVVPFRTAVEKANEEIWENGGTAGMKSTVAAVWFDDHAALAANVGDTRIYQFRDGKVIFQSRDHSMAQMAVRAGDIRPEEVRTCKERHKLIRALGAQDEVCVDISHLDLQTGDAILICTDGFWEKIQETEMAYDLAGVKTAAGWLEKMRLRLNDRGAADGDNHSAVAILMK